MTTTPKLIIGWRARLIRSRIQLYIVAEAFKLSRNPVLAFSELKRIIILRNNVQGSNGMLKYVKSGNKFYLNADYGGYHSENFKRLIQNELLKNRRDGKNRTVQQPLLQTLIWGITNRCPLACRHCYEWDNIAQTDSLNLDKLKNILNIFKANGIRHIQFSGGEPLARFNDLVELITEASPTMDCWLLTSGFSFCAEKALALKKAGLTGAHISLDHWEALLHNNFRNNEKSYEMVMEAVKNCLDAGIMVSLSLCATREFVNVYNLMRYAKLAKDIGANFIRILEPRAVGKFANQKVTLEEKQVELLSEFTELLNTNSLYKDFPIVIFSGYNQLKRGCYGAGNRYVYADPNGDVHACPFCRGKMGNLLEESFNSIIERIKGSGCHQFVSLP
jgi:MoaA/NifB/PqqE/SkfB family radical SAM enzyme